MCAAAEQAPAPPLLASLHGNLSSLLGGLANRGEAVKAAVRIHFQLPTFVQPVHSSNSSWLSQKTAPPSIANLSGTWIKDKSASDSMEPAVRVMQLGGIIRQAVKLLKGVTVKQDAESITIEVFSVIGWFKTVERYRFDGTPATFKRRDMRRGTHVGHFKLLPPATPPGGAVAVKKSKAVADSDDAEQAQQGRFAIDIAWGEPHSGIGSDSYELVAPNVLHVWSEMTVCGQQVKTRSIFHRKV